MAKLTGTTGPIASIAAFLQSFADARLRRAYFDLQWANSPSNPARLNAERDKEEADRKFRMQLAIYEADRADSRAIKAPKDYAAEREAKIAEQNALSPLRIAEAADRARAVGGVASDLYPEQTRLAADRAAAMTGARIGAYTSRGLRAPGSGKQGTGPLAGFRVSDFLRIKDSAERIVEAAAKAELETRKDRLTGSINVKPGSPEYQSLLYFNPRRWDAAMNEAMLSQIKPFVGTGDRYKQLMAHLNAGGSISDLFLQGVTEDLPDQVPVEPPPEEDPMVRDYLKGLTGEP